MRDWLIFITFITIGSAMALTGHSFNAPASLLISIFMIFIPSFIGIATESLRKFLLCHHVIQTGYVLLDIAVALYVGKNPLLSLVQLGNYVIAGILLLLCTGRPKLITEIKPTKSSLIGLTVAALSLGGLPLFNLFVSEFPIYIFAYEITPLLTGLLLTASLIVLLNYIRLLLPVYYKDKAKDNSTIKKLTIYSLSLICLILGVIPQIELTIFEALS